MKENSPTSNSNQFYKNAIESLEDYCVFTTDLKGDLVSWNKGAENITGYTEGEVIGQNAAIFFTPEDVATGKPELELTIAREEGRAVNERWHVKKDESRFWGSGLVFPLIDDLEGHQGYIKVMRDNTLTLMVTRALETERTKLERIFEKAPSFLVVFRGAEHVIERVNEAYLVLSGKNDLVGKPLLEAIPEMEGQPSLQELDNVFHTGIPYHANEVKLTFTGTKNNQVKEVFINLVYQADFDIKGAIIGVIAHGYEVTTQVVAQQALQAATEAQAAILEQKESFIGIVSHELKTPITSMKAYAQFLQANLLRDGLEQQANLVGKISSQIDKLQVLVNDLLDVTKLNGGRLQFNDELFDFDAMLAEVVEDMQHTSPSHQIITRLQPIGMVWADKFRITQVLVNLISNAIKYSPYAKEIVVSAAIQEDQVLVCVQDFGIGIAAENQQQLFSPFYRVMGANEAIFKGLGLGLYISSEIIKGEGGRMWVESVDGGGSTFCFSLDLDRRNALH